MESLLPKTTLSNADPRFYHIILSEERLMTLIKKSEPLNKDSVDKLVKAA